METSPQPAPEANTVLSDMKEPWHAPLNRVTTVSKILAAVVFITLPFVGFWLGMGWGEKMSEVPVVETVEQSTSIAVSSDVDTRDEKNLTLQSSNAPAEDDITKLLPKEFFNTPAIRPQTKILAVGDLNDDGFIDAYAQDYYTPGQGVADHTLDVVLIADQGQGGAANKIIVTFPENFVPDLKRVSIADGYLLLSGSHGSVYQNEVPFFYDGGEMLKIVPRGD